MFKNFMGKLVEGVLNTENFVTTSADKTVDFTKYHGRNIARESSIITAKSTSWVTRGARKGYDKFIDFLFADEEEAKKNGTKGNRSPKPEVKLISNDKVVATLGLDSMLEPYFENFKKISNVISDLALKEMGKDELPKEIKDIITTTTTKLNASKTIEEYSEVLFQVITKDMLSLMLSEEEIKFVDKIVNYENLKVLLTDLVKRTIMVTISQTEDTIAEFMASCEVDDSIEDKIVVTFLGGRKIVITEQEVLTVVTSEALPFIQLYIDKMKKKEA